MDSTSTRLLRRTMIFIVLTVVVCLFQFMSPFASAQEPLPDLIITGSADPNPLPNNSTLTYTIIVSNIGDAPAGPAEFPIKVSAVFLSDFSFKSLEVTPPVTCSASTGGIQCELTTLGQGESITIIFTVTVSTEHDVVGIAAVVDLPISYFVESIETLNNIANIETAVLQPNPVGGVALDGAIGRLPLEEPGASRAIGLTSLWLAVPLLALLATGGVALRRQRF